jgi:16S rRNA (uracil1498-N3)-methyltransferase
MEKCIPFDAMVAAGKGEDGLKTILWEAEGAQDLKTLLKTSSGVESFVGVVGPEGGFAGKEIDIAREAGFVPVSLGNRILRSETAAITTVAIVQYELGDLNVRHL